MTSISLQRSWYSKKIMEEGVSVIKVYVDTPKIKFGWTASSTTVEWEKNILPTFMVAAAVEYVEYSSAVDSTVNCPKL